MLRLTFICVAMLFCTMGIVGCGGDGGGPAQMQEQPAYTDADANAAADYEKMQQENQKKGYGN